MATNKPNVEVKHMHTSKHLALVGDAFYQQIKGVLRLKPKHTAKNHALVGMPSSEQYTACRAQTQ